MGVIKANDLIDLKLGSVLNPPAGFSLSFPFPFPFPAELSNE
jgi:hypothetical protein